MQAEVLDLRARFDIQLEVRADGTFGPPAIVMMSMRPCWRKPAVQLTLVFLYELDGVAYYASIRRDA